VRANVLGERLRRTRDVLPVDRNELLTSLEFHRVRDMRHFAEHLDERIASGRVGEGGVSPLTVAPYADCIAYGGTTVSYVEIGEWITRLESSRADCWRGQKTATPMAESSRKCLRCTWHAAWSAAAGGRDNLRRSLRSSRSDRSGPEGYAEAVGDTEWARNAPYPAVLPNTIDPDEPNTA
jgi:hypothetical protein